MIARTQKYSAWRSRGMTWVETGSGERPIFSQTYSSTKGSILAKVPTAPEIAPVAIVLAGGLEAAPVAVHLGVPGGELEAEGDRLGVDAVGAPHADRVLVFVGAGLDRGEDLVEVGQQFVGCLGELHREAGVEDVRGGHPLVDEARLGADVLGDRGEKGDDVMLDLGFDGIDPGDIEIPLVADHFDRRPGDHAEFGLSLASQGFDFQPDAETVFRFPDAGHFRPGITWDHRVRLLSI